MATIIILALFGIVLVGLEIFLPGGILGIVGIGCSVTALVMCFTTESVTEVGLWFSFVLAACVVGVTAAVLVLWLKHFQRTGLGKLFVLQSAVGGGKVARSHLIGEEGEVVNALRPLGTVLINGVKIDARAESGAGMVEKGKRVRVVGVSGMELEVREIGEAEAE